MIEARNGTVELSNRQVYDGDILGFLSQPVKVVRLSV